MQGVVAALELQDFVAAPSRREAMRQACMVTSVPLAPKRTYSRIALCKFPREFPFLSWAAEGLPSWSPLSTAFTTADGSVGHQRAEAHSCGQCIRCHRRREYGWPFHPSEERIGLVVAIVAGNAKRKCVRGPLGAVADSAVRFS